MAIIMRSSGQKRDQDDKRKIYTWVGCGLVVVLALISIVPNMGGEKKPDYSRFTSTRMQDLAALPFGTDEDSEEFLQDNPSYSRVADAELNALFSSEEREERQAKDKAEGVPPPPDAEYKDIAKDIAKEQEVKNIQAARAARKKREKEERRQQAQQKAVQARQTPNNKQTQPQNFRTGGNSLGNSSGLSGVTGSIWAHNDKNKKGSVAAAAGHSMTQQDLNFLAKNGRTTGLDVAAIKSEKAAKEEDLEKAASEAIKAFQEEVDADELEKDKEELGIEEGASINLDEDMGDKLRSSIKDEVDKQNAENKDKEKKGKEYSVNENCFSNTGKFDWGCFGMKVGMKLFDSALSCASSGCWNSWKYNGTKDGVFEKNGFTYLYSKDNGWSCIDCITKE